MGRLLRGDLAMVAVVAAGAVRLLVAPELDVHGPEFHHRRHGLGDRPVGGGYVASAADAAVIAFASAVTLAVEGIDRHMVQVPTSDPVAELGVRDRVEHELVPGVVEVGRRAERDARVKGQKPQEPEGLVELALREHARYALPDEPVDEPLEQPVIDEVPIGQRLCGRSLISGHSHRLLPSLCRSHLLG